VAADPVTGHVYVVDAANNRISEFTSWGEFVKAWGWGVADGTTEALQTCTAICFSGIAGTGAGQFEGPSAITVDSAGNVFVKENSAGGESGGVANFRVQKFDRDGNFLLMFGGEVNKTTTGDICTAASGNVCGAGISGTGDGEFASTTALVRSLDIGPDGSVYVGDVGRIQVFEPSGAFKKEIEIPGETIMSLGVDSAGFVYATFAADPFRGKDDVTKFSSGGSVVEVFPIVSASWLTVDPADNVFVVTDPDPLGFGTPVNEPRIAEFSSSGAVLIPPSAEFGIPPQGARTSPLLLQALGSNVLGDGSSTPGDLYVTVIDEGRQYLVAYGPLPQFEPAPAKPPKIRGQSAGPVGDTSAAVSAEINPRFFASTTYYVEYGTEPCSSGGCISVKPAPPGAPLGAERNAFVRSAPIELEGLQPGTQYHFRFVAISGAFETVGEGEDSEGHPLELEATFTTFRGIGDGLLDERAYELVSPPDKENGEAGSPETSSGLVSTTVAPQQAALNGEGLTYTSFTSFGEDPKSAPAASQYLSKRTASGWRTNNITPADRESFLADPLRGFSPDLELGAVIQKDPPLVEGASQGFQNLYVQANDAETLELVSGPEPTITVPKTSYCVGFAGATDDFSHVIFTARGALREGDPVAAGQNLYEWVRGEGLRLVSVLPTESAAPPTGTTAFGPAGNECLTGPTILRNAISADGSNIFWTRGTTTTQLMARINGTQTVQLDKTQGGSGPAGNGVFWAASDDGSIVYFTAQGKLTAGAGNGDLYRYDFEAPVGSRLTDIAKAGLVQGVLGASEDGSSVYFAAASVLDAEEGPTGEVASAGQPNLYLWSEAGGIEFISTLEASDSTDWSARPNNQTARITPDGGALAYLSRRPLTGFDNRAQAGGGAPVSELFVYDAGENELRCASCNPTGSRPLGPAAVPTWWSPFEQPRYLSNSGARTFFESEDSLDPRDKNGKTDVYEFELAGEGSCSEAAPTFSPDDDGCLALVSSGTQAAPSVLVDASPAGVDVFFSTPQRLTWEDRDQRYDIYDARSSGGFPEPPSPPAPCFGEACRPPVSSPPPSPAPPASSQTNGAGNVNEANKAKHCRKGQRRVKKKGRVRCEKKHSHKASKKGRAGK
jgi:hypothetical protein